MIQIRGMQISTNITIKVIIKRLISYRATNVLNELKHKHIRQCVTVYNNNKKYLFRTIIYLYLQKMFFGHIIVSCVVMIIKDFD